MVQSVEPSPQLVDSALAAVLARPEFTPPPVSPLQRLMGQVLGWLRDRLVELFQWLLPTLDPEASGWVVLGRIALFVLGLAGLWLVVRLALLLVHVRRRSERRVLEIDVTGMRGPRTPAEWEMQAGHAVSEGRWRDAVIALYHAVVGRLAESGVLRADPAKTPGDYRREARADPRFGPSLDAFVRQFEPLAFGRRVADAETYARLRDVASILGARG